MYDWACVSECIGICFFKEEAASLSADPVVLSSVASDDDVMKQRTPNKSQWAERSNQSLLVRPPALAAFQFSVEDHWDTTSHLISHEAQTGSSGEPGHA